jgi:mandelamide amidase
MEDDSSVAMTKSLIDLSATDAVAAMRQGDMTAEAYASALLERCEAGKHLNAFISFEPERVLLAARAADTKRASGATLAALHGLPIPVKDSVNTRDYPTTGGTKALRDFYPAEDSVLVRNLKDAGAIVLGKTNIHELSFGWTSNNQEFGAVHNPYDTSRIPGGSSGGTAAAIAARMAPIGIRAGRIVRRLWFSAEPEPLSESRGHTDHALVRPGWSTHAQRRGSRLV